MPLHANLNPYLKWFALGQPGIWEPCDNGASAVRFRGDHILPIRGLCSIWLFSHLQGVYCSFSLRIFLKLIFIYLHINIWICVISILIHQRYSMSVVLLVWASCLALGTWTLNGTQALLIYLGLSSSSWSWRRLHSEKNSYKWLKVKSGITPRDGESWRNWLASSLVFFIP